MESSQALRLVLTTPECMLWAPTLNQVSIRKTLPQQKALNHSTRRRSLNLICFSVNRRSLTSTHPYHSVELNVYTSEQTSASALVGDSVCRFFSSAVLLDYTQAVANFVGTVPTGFLVHHLNTRKCP